MREDPYTPPTPENGTPENEQVRKPEKIIKKLEITVEEIPNVSYQVFTHAENMNAMEMIGVLTAKLEEAKAQIKPIQV